MRKFRRKKLVSSQSIFMPPPYLNAVKTSATTTPTATSARESEHPQQFRSRPVALIQPLKYFSIVHVTAPHVTTPKKWPGRKRRAPANTLSNAGGEGFM